MRASQPRASLGAVPGPDWRLPLSPQVAMLRLARDPIQRMGELFEQYGAVVSLLKHGGTRIFSNESECPGTVFVRGPELLRQMETDGERFYRTPLSGQLYPLGNPSKRRVALTEWATGLFGVNGADHRRHRRILAQPFKANRVAGYLDGMLDAIERQLSEWRDGEEIDLHREMMRLSLTIALTAFFGCDIRGHPEIARAQERSLRLVLSPWVLAAPVDAPGFPYRRFLDAANAFNREMRALIAEKRQAGCEGGDVLSRLIRAASEDGAGLSEGEVVGHAGVIFAAGQETTSNGLTFALFLLSQHPEDSRELFEELVSVIGDGRPSAGELEGLPVLDRVVREALRIMPPAPWNARVLTAGVEMGGYELPRHTEVIGSIFHTHRLEELYPEPRRFVPNRWIDAQRDPFEFNPFGGGARQCLGSSFALLEMKAVIATVVRRFRLGVVPKSSVDPVVNITMSLRKGLRMRINKQDGAFERSVEPVKGGIHRFIDLGGQAG